MTAPGLIPAHAGSTPFGRFTCPPIGAHPRSRGEHEETIRYAIARSGSSPLTRGAPLVCVCQAEGKRLIPAHAGSTGAAAGAGGVLGAHPRSRGEHREFVCQQIRYLGSSPLTRGALIRPPLFLDG